MDKPCGTGICPVLHGLLSAAPEEGFHLFSCFFVLASCLHKYYYSVIIIDN